MRTIIAGYGQIGRALYEVLSCYDPKVIDPALRPKRRRLLGEPEGPRVADADELCDVLHVAFPYTKTFVEEVKKYQKAHKPKVTVIHSTVPEGTSRSLGAVFSPVVGLHPFLVEGIRTFTKYLAGENASLVADYFRRAGLRVYLMENSDALEYSKLRQTKFYALQVEFVKHTARQCKQRGYSFSEAYTLPSADYNRGYAELGRPEYHLPLLVPIMTKQGGHCTIPNLDLQPDSWSQVIKKCNEDTNEEK